MRLLLKVKTELNGWNYVILTCMCGNYTKTRLVTVSLIRSTLLNLHVSQVQSHSSNCSSRDYLYSMVGLTHLRQDAVLSAKNLD